MNKTIIMIPARINSSRVPKKNIRLINGKPLVAYAIEAALLAVQGGVADEVYVNSEDDLIGEIAGSYSDFNVKFYKRNAFLSNDDIQNEWFVQDFIKNVPCETLIQLLPTSPFITTRDICDFYSYMLKRDLDTLVSVKNVQIECMYDTVPVNFMKSHFLLPSQKVKPVQAYACGLMAWKTSVYMSNMHIGGPYHGFTGKTDYFTLSGYATIDIDNENDFILADQIAKSLQNKYQSEPEYYQSGDYKKRVEVDVPSILEGDGIVHHNFDYENRLLSYIPACINEMGSAPWSYRLINTKSNSATLIAQLPGQGNRRHYHPDWDEWWYIVQGEYLFEVNGMEHRVNTGQIVFIKSGLVHKITAIGDGPAIRLAVSRADVKHVYV